MSFYKSFETLEEANAFIESNPDFLKQYRQDDTVSSVLGRIIWRKRARQ